MNTLNLKDPFFAYAEIYVLAPLIVIVIYKFYLNTKI
jgi:hypothetical protein